MKSEYSKYDWIMWSIVIVWLSTFVFSWVFNSVILLMICIVFLIVDWGFSLWNRKRRQKILNDLMEELSGVLKDVSESLSKTEEILKKEEDENVYRT
jgi:hypothetical protein